MISIVNQIQYIKVIIVFTNIFVIKKIDKLSFKSKHSFLDQLLNDSNKFNKLKPQKGETTKKN